MNRKIFFLFAAVSFMSCSQYSGPEYYSANPEGNNKNMGTYDESSYGEDISKLSMILNNAVLTGTSPVKATREMYDGKQIVNISEYQFTRNDQTYIFFMRFPDFRGVGAYNGEDEPVTIKFNRKKLHDDDVIETHWESDPDIKVKVTKSDSKYLEVKFEGPFTATGSESGSPYVSLGEIRVQWQR